MKNYKVFLKYRNERWIQALERFHAFCEADMKEYFSIKDYSYRFIDNRAYNYNISGKTSTEYLDEFVEQYGVKVPDELSNLLCDYGSFRIGASLLEIYENRIYTLPQVLSKYGNGEFVNKITPGMLKSLSGFYFFFGVSFPESEEMDFLYFNKAGNFGKMLFAPNNHSLVLKKILPSMFNGSIEKYSLDDLISVQIDRVIVNALTVRGYIE